MLPRRDWPHSKRLGVGVPHIGYVALPHAAEPRGGQTDLGQPGCQPPPLPPADQPAAAAAPAAAPAATRPVAGRTNSGDCCGAGRCCRSSKTKATRPSANRARRPLVDLLMDRMRLADRPTVLKKPQRGGTRRSVTIAFRVEPNRHVPARPNPLDLHLVSVTLQRPDRRNRDFTNPVEPARQLAANNTTINPPAGGC